MKLNAIEKALMNNPARALLQRQYEAPLLKRMGGSLEGARVLEVGCGRGVGTDILFTHFGAQTVYAFDLDPDMVQQARRRLQSYPPARLTLTVGSVTQIAAPSAAFDAVVDVGIIHHVPDWRAAIAEVCRVLRPGGRFFFEEVTRHALNRWAYRTFLDHPRQDRFSGTEFLAELERHGLTVVDSVELFFGDFVVGVAQRGIASPDGAEMP
ncbi:MAG: class I SAM-dependent methyltransferase [Chloroflexi bacterium OHK40]